MDAKIKKTLNYLLSNTDKKYASRLTAGALLTPHVYAHHPLTNSLCHVLDSDGVKTVSLSAGKTTCDCEDWQWEAPLYKNNPLCAHIAAFHLMTIANLPLPEYPYEPAKIRELRWLETTNARYNVIGVFVESKIVMYTHTQNRFACVNEIVDDAGEWLRLVGYGQKIRAHLVTEEEKANKYTWMNTRPSWLAALEARVTS